MSASTHFIFERTTILKAMKKLLSLILIAVFIVSCSENPVNSPSGGNPPVSGDSLIFSVDSIVFRSINNSNFRKTYKLSPADSLKIQFTGLTNIDSSNATLGVGLYLGDSVWNVAAYYIWGTYSQIEFNNIHTIRTPSHWYPRLYLHILTSIQNSQPAGEKFIILKNVKIYKVRPQ